MRCLVYGCFLRVHSGFLGRLLILLRVALTVLAEEKKITRVQFTRYYVVFPFCKTFGSLKISPSDSLFNIIDRDCRANQFKVFCFVVALVRTLQSSQRGVNMF